MADQFSWTCPYCNRDCTITGRNLSVDTHFFSKNNKIGDLGLETSVIICPNENCKEFVIEGTLYHDQCINATHNTVGSPIHYWKMKPSSHSKQFPDFIPKAIIVDYEEACLIRDLSPKASATLSRRCLQGIIRDYWSITKGRLVDEINAIQDKVDPITWQAIDSVRSIGNIGAHMEKDINLIIDVEPEEAQLLIGLIEILIKDWYIVKHERQKYLESIIGVADQKAAEKKNIQ